MHSYKVRARVVCHCARCEEKDRGVPFFDDFVAADKNSAIALAKAKFIMIHDDIVEEFRGEGHCHILEILSCD